MKYKILLLAMLAILQACGSSNVKDSKPANVTSDPAGASVYANGAKLGVTPLRVNLFKAFPAGWDNWVLSAQGVLMIKKSGCEDFMLKVNDAIISQPIHAKLNCDKAAATAKQEADTQLQPAASTIVSPASPKASQTEERLSELKELYEKGVITKQEYAATRKRILSEL